MCNMDRRYDTDEACHCGREYEGCDHCLYCGCEQYESGDCGDTWCGHNDCFGCCYFDTERTRTTTMFDLLTYDARANASDRRRACARRAEDLNRQDVMREARREGMSAFVLVRATDQWGAPFSALLGVFQ